MSRPYADESVYRAIADPTRRRIIELLRTAESSGGDLARTLTVAAPTLSHHLGVLRSAGLISQQRIGRNRKYRLHAHVLRIPAAWLQRHRA